MAGYSKIYCIGGEGGFLGAEMGRKTGAAKKNTACEPSKNRKKCLTFEA